MNELILREFNENQVVYNYLPEGKGSPGEVIYNFMSGETIISERAQNDNYGRYGQYAVRRITEYIDKQNLPMKAIQAWN